jgi:carbamoylphosphate synthase large subunit
MGDLIASSWRQDVARPYPGAFDVAALGDLQKPKPKVLLCATCRWTCTPKLAIALADEGCEVVALVPRVHPLRHTRVVSGFRKYSAMRPLSSLARSIKKFAPDLIIPCDDRAVTHLHRLYGLSCHQSVRKLIAHSMGDPENFNKVQSRASALALAKENGVRLPETRSLDTIGDLDDWAATHAFPWVIKSDGSWGGEGVAIVSDMRAARRAFRRLSRAVHVGFALRQLILHGDFFPLTAWLHRPSRCLSVQAYIEGRPANCAIATWNGETDAVLCAEVLSSDGRTGPASLIRLTGNNVMGDAGAAVAKALKLSGLVGADFVIETATGWPYLIELNPRATPICHLQLGAGRDLIAALKARMTGAPAQPRESAITSDVIALFPQGERVNEGSAMLDTAYVDAPLSDRRLMERLRRPPLIDRRRIAAVLSRIGFNVDMPQAQTWDA